MSHQREQQGFLRGLGLPGHHLFARFKYSNRATLWHCIFIGKGRQVVFVHRWPSHTRYFLTSTQIKEMIEQKLIIEVKDYEIKSDGKHRVFYYGGPRDVVRVQGVEVCCACWYHHESSCKSLGALTTYVESIDELLKPPNTPNLPRKADLVEQVGILAGYPPLVRVK